MGPPAPQAKDTEIDSEGKSPGASPRACNGHSPDTPFARHAPLPLSHTVKAECCLVQQFLAIDLVLGCNALRYDTLSLSGFLMAGLSWMRVLLHGM